VLAPPTSGTLGRMYEVTRLLEAATVGDEDRVTSLEMEVGGRVEDRAGELREGR